MDLGMIQDSTMSIWSQDLDVTQRKVFPSVRDTNLLVRNGSELIDINLDRRLICGRMSIGLVGATPAWSPGSSKAGEMLLWTPNQMRRLRLRSAVATLISGSRSWVPSLIVEREARDPLREALDEIPPERRPMTFVDRSSLGSLDGDRLVAPSGVVESVKPPLVRSVSSDGRFVLTVDHVLRDFEGGRAKEGDTFVYGGESGSGISSPKFEVIDLLTDGRRVLERLDGTGSEIVLINGGARSHCWAEVDGTPVYVGVALPKAFKNSSGQTRREPHHSVFTWSALDGSLLSSAPLRSIISPIANSIFSIDHSAVSADGRFVAVSGKFIDRSSKAMKEARSDRSGPLHLADGGVFICERSTGEVVDSYVLPAIPQRICLSADGSHLAALVASGGDGMEPATLVVYPNRGLDTVRHLLEHVVQSIKLPGSFMMTFRPNMPSDTIYSGPTLSFSPDGDLVSVALETSIHLVDVPGRMLVCSFDWTGLVRLLGSESGLSPEVANALKSGQPEFQQVLFDGAGFSEDGRELRIGIRDAEIALIRIRDTAWN